MFLAVSMLPLELYEKQRLLKRARETFSRMLGNWPNIHDVKFSQNHQHVYIQTAREKLISLKDHLSDALWLQRYIGSWSPESTAANALPWNRSRDWPFLTHCSKSVADCLLAYQNYCCLKACRSMLLYAHRTVGSVWHQENISGWKLIWVKHFQLQSAVSPQLS